MAIYRFASTKARAGRALRSLLRAVHAPAARAQRGADGVRNFGGGGAGGQARISRGLAGGTPLHARLLPFEQTGAVPGGGGGAYGKPAPGPGHYPIALSS